MSYYDVAYSTRETIENTKFFTDYVLDARIPGALVECGVAAGAQIGGMQSRNIERVEKRWIYGFDSFEGIPLASADDDEQPGIPGPKPFIPYKDTRELLKSSGVTVHAREHVQHLLNVWFPGKWDNIVLVKGWFQDTLPLYSSVLKRLGGIALLRLDGDLYESTKVSLEHLFPLVAPDGIIIIDDWDLTGCRKACDEYFETHPVRQIPAPYGDGKGPAYFQKEAE
jgi:O-methyltransferase